MALVRIAAASADAQEVLVSRTAPGGDPCARFAEWLLLLDAPQPSTAGKPPAVVEKMVAGRLNKFYEEAVLLDQKFLLDDSIKVSSVIDK